MRVLFWNTNKNDNINSVLTELIIDNNISIVVLAEYTANMKELVHYLSLRGKEMKPYITNGCDRIQILGNELNVEPSVQSSHASMQIINNNYILCCVHLNSKIHSGHEERRNIIIEQIINDILDIEERMNTKNTIIVGDFNINPYEHSCISARYFHGMPIFEEAKRKSRTVAEKEFFMFYNPMWNFLGDHSKPYGTYYYGGSDVENTYWNIYDQVIIRPNLRQQFVDESLEIVTETVSISLLDSKGHPNKQISDHLPIIFEIKED